MAFFNHMKGKLSQASQTTVQKAKDLTEIARLNAAISDAEHQIIELYGKIGYEVCRAYREKPLPEVEGLIKQVSDLHKDIDNCKKQIQTINAVNTCPKCGAKMNKGMAFCSACGHKFMVEEQPVTGETIALCDECGAELSADSAFCASCGKKIE